MAKFQIGERVRLIYVDVADLRVGLVPGQEGEVREESDIPYVRWDYYRHPGNDGLYAVLEEQLERAE